MIDAVDRQLRPLDQELRALARRQPVCRALISDYGIREITSAAIPAALRARPDPAGGHRVRRHVARRQCLDELVHGLVAT
jgi:transposase